MLNTPPSRDREQTAANRNTHRVIEPIDVQDHRFGPLVVGTQEELSFPAAGRSCCFGLFGLFFASGLQQLVDFRGQQFGFSRGCAPSVRKKRSL